MTILHEHAEFALILNPAQERFNLSGNFVWGRKKIVHIWCEPSIGVLPLNAKSCSLI